MTDEITQRINTFKADLRKEWLREEIVKLEAMYPKSCDCVDVTYECAHWGRHMLLDKLIDRYQAELNEK